MPLDCVCFSLIIDDVVLPDGTTHMGLLGGGGPQTLFGYQLQTGQQACVGLAAGVGADLPQACRAWLQKLGVDVKGLRLTDRPTPRAWQVCENDGRRTQVWRMEPSPELYRMLRPEIADLPPHFLASRAYIMGVHPERLPLHVLHQLRPRAHEFGGCLMLETFTHASSQLTRESLQHLMAACDIFSPNHHEAQSMLGSGAPLGLCCELLRHGRGDGPKVVVMRCGAEGSVVARSDGSGRAAEAWSIPAFTDIDVVDVTGCGDAYCGAFMAAWQAEQELGNAGAWGSVAGSFLAECHGVPPQPAVALYQKARERFAAVKQQIKRLI
ncbi:hypothetical protein WJX72_000160 [[Myrmecia] bisecta]|uniref:Carbohydrate kinase PfkB domain-containing protein n=1 Tax=[Myrmecia] bisecta TaxID=41462 RepID=A0AAW1PZI5_9CHLO